MLRVRRGSTSASQPAPAPPLGGRRRPCASPALAVFAIYLQIADRGVMKARALLKNAWIVEERQNEWVQRALLRRAGWKPHSPSTDRGVEEVRGEEGSGEKSSAFKHLCELAVLGRRGGWGVASNSRASAGRCWDGGWPPGASRNLPTPAVSSKYKGGKTLYCYRGGFSPPLPVSQAALRGARISLQPALPARSPAGSAASPRLPLAASGPAPRPRDTGCRRPPAQWRAFTGAALAPSRGRAAPLPSQLRTGGRELVREGGAAGEQPAAP